MKQFIFCSMILFVVSSCQSQQSPKNAAPLASGEQIEYNFSDVTAEQAKTIISRSQGALQIIDVRTPSEVSGGMIKGAINIDFQASDFKSKIAALDKNKGYLVYCHAGGRSAKTSAIMKELGFNHVYNMKDGYSNWKE
jgi:rhodanese-related sulfurtransferase